MGHEVEHLVFDVGPHHMFTHCIDKQARLLKFVIHEVLEECLAVVEVQLIGHSCLLFFFQFIPCFNV